MYSVVHQPFPMRPRPYRLIALFLVCSVAAGCVTTSATYSPAAAREIAGLKSRSLRLMEKAEFPFPDHSDAVEKLRRDLGTALVRAESRRKNSATVRQWEVLLGADRHLLGGFLIRWQEDGSLSTTFIVEARLLVAAAFDELALHESRKNGAPR